ncbi:M56 family metallopeptidase [Salegentibacter sp. F188]|uniref:M56 family metallopeptidase n=1 Tax=Autumnicola patrickiae TaxID=3075591 RepID=A0ABU3E3K5_9FLAO|nr:M56 family metallopeptidase [Salegentibacter sp. F188]MDT0690510.1 M56 family metallopeptidase [Salegentibacter sp. F188]
MSIYLLKSALCLLVLFIFYKMALENEKMHQFKRFYLLGVFLLSLLIPLITFSYETEAIKVPVQSQETIEFRESAENGNFRPSAEAMAGVLSYTLWTLYGIGFAIFGFRFLRNLLQIKNKIRNNKKIASAKCTTVLLRTKTAPHSFLKYIFLNKKDFEEERIAPQILAHEQAHVMQKHSWDILFVEILQVVFWFNPLLFFLKKSIQINHEFLADEKVISENNQVLDYSKLLLNYSAGIHHTSMSSAFNHLLIKKRILMITKPFSWKKLVAKLSLLLPVIATCLLLFNNKIVAKPASVEFPSSELQQDYLFYIEVEGEKIKLNGEEVKLQGFAKKLDEITDKYNEEEIKNGNIRLRLMNIPDEFEEKLNKEYKKTTYFKLNPSEDGLFPPAPPAPQAPPSLDELPEPPAPPVPPALVKQSKVELSRTEALEKRMAILQEKEKRMEQRQEELEKQQEMLKRLQKSEELQAITEERKEELEQRRQEMEKRAEKLRDSAIILR